MAQSGKIDDIRVGIGLDVGKLRREAGEAKRILRDLVGTYPIKLTLDRTELEKDLKENPLTVGDLQASSEALTKLRSQIESEMGAVTIKAFDADPQALAKLREDITEGIGTITVKTRWGGWEGGAPGGGGGGGFGGGPGGGFGGGGFSPYRPPGPPPVAGLLGPGRGMGFGVPVGTPWGGPPFGAPGRPGPRMLPPGRIPTVTGDILDANGNLILAGRAGFPAPPGPSGLPGMSHPIFPRVPPSRRSVPNQPFMGTGRLPRPTGPRRTPLGLTPEMVAEGYTRRARLRMGVGKFADSEGSVVLGGRRQLGPPEGWSEEQKRDWWAKFYANKGDRRLDNAMTTFDTAIQKTTWTSPAMKRFFANERMRESMIDMVRRGVNPSGSLGYVSPAVAPVDPNAIRYLTQGAASRSGFGSEGSGLGFGGSGADNPYSRIAGPMASRITGGTPLALAANAESLAMARASSTNWGPAAQLLGPAGLMALGGQAPMRGLVAERHPFVGGRAARKCQTCGRPRGDTTHGLSENRPPGHRELSKIRLEQQRHAVEALKSDRGGTLADMMVDVSEIGNRSYAGGGTINLNPGKGRSLRVRGNVGRYVDAMGQRYSLRYGRNPTNPEWENALDIVHFGGRPWIDRRSGRTMPGERAGNIVVKHDDQQYRDVNPFIASHHQKRGLGTAGYTMLEHLGVPVEAMSNANATGLFKMSGHYQTGPGSRFWQSRKRAEGWTQEDIDAAMGIGGMLGNPGGLLQTLGRLKASGKPFQGMSGGGIMRQPAPGHASGMLPGLMGMPGAVLVGERGPEVAVLPHGTAVIPNHMKHYLQQKSMADGGINYGRSGFRQGSGAAYRAGVASPVGGPTLAGFGGQMVLNPGPAGLGLGSRGAGGIMIDYSGAIGGPRPPGSPRTGGTTPPGFTFAPPAGGPGGPIPVTVAGVSPGAAGTIAGAAAGGGGGMPPFTPPGRAGGGFGGPSGGAAGPFSPTGGAPDPEGRREARARAFITGKEAGFDLRELFTEQSSRISDALNLTPARALTVTFGQLGQELFGGRQQLRGRTRAASAAVGIASSFLGRQEAQAGELADLRIRQDLARRGAPINKADETRDFDREIQDATKSLSALQEATNTAVARGEVAVFGREGARRRNEHRPEVRAEINRAARDLQAEEDERFQREGGQRRSFEDPLIRRRDVARSLGVGAVSLTAGSIAFTALVKVFNVGLELMSKVAGNAADELMGFAATANRVTGEMAQLVGGKGLASGATLSGAFGQAGISQALLTNLSQRSQTIAGAQRFTEQMDFLRAERNTAAGGAGRGIWQDTGNGFMPGTPLSFIGQTPTIFENLKNNLTPYGLNQGFRESQMGWEGLAAFATGGEAGLQEYRGRQAADWQRHMSEVDAANARTLSNTNEQATKGGGAGLVRLSGSALEASTAAFEKFDTDLAKKLSDLGLGIVDATEEGVKAFGQAVARGANMMSIPEVIGGMRTQLQARSRDMGRQRAFTNSTSIPADFATQMAANPFSANQGQGFFTAGAGGGIGRQVWREYREEIKGARKDVLAAAADGEKALLRLGVPQQQITDYKALGAEVKDLRDQAENLQLGVEQQQWNRQLFVSKRTIGDIIGLQGRQSVNVAGMTIEATKLGKIQRQQLLLERESSRVALARNRREIEFQLALSRINTPGATAEERATRAREADLIAAESLAELGRNEQQRSLGIQAQNIGIDRDAKDAIYTLSQAVRERNIQFQIRGVEKVLEAKELYMGLQTQIFESTKAAGEDFAKLTMGVVADVESATGDFTGKVADEVNKALNGKNGMLSQFQSGYDEMLAYVQENPLVPELGGEGQSSGPVRGRNGVAPTARRRASGGIDHVSSPTRFMAGEAGSETVMVLRNPRAGMMAGTRGGGGASINLGGVHFHGEVSMDSDRRVQQLADRVERMLHQKAAMVGAMFDG